MDNGFPMPKEWSESMTSYRQITF